MAKFFFGAGENSPVSLVHTTLLFIIRLRARCYLYFIFFHISYKKPVGRSIPFIDQFISTEVEGEREKRRPKETERKLAQEIPGVRAPMGISYRKK